MKKIKKSYLRLTTLIFIFPLIGLLLYGGLSQLFFFYTQHNEVEHELKKYEKTLMDAQKDTLQEKVENLTQFIHYYDGRSSEKIKEDVKNIVNVTADMANNLYAENYQNISETSLKSLIKSALRKIKFEGDIGYLFLLDLEGNALVHADKQVVGMNILNIQDVKGKYILKEFNKVLKSKGEGFVDYYWYIVSEDKKEMHYKISYVKLLDCYNWYIGAGEYLKYMTKFVQKDILQYIQVNATFKNGYFFITNKEGQFIFYPQNKREKKTNIIHNIGFSKNMNQISYTQYVEEYGWYVTATKDLKEIQSSIESKKVASATQAATSIKTNLYLLLLSWVVSLLLSLYLSTVINRMLKKYEERLTSANDKLVFQSRQALIGELFSMIAHQWRQPINKIASILALLRFGLPAKKMSHKEIDLKCQEIEESVEFMSETIDDFRTFYQPKEESEKVNIKILIEKSIDFLEAAIRKKDITVVKELEDIEFELYGNEFVQVMINLIKNAVDALDTRGRIEIKLLRNEECIVISVADNGKGIDDVFLEKVFDPYFTTKEDSMGLGLYMTKMIVEKHMKGKIEVEKISFGMKFIILLKEK
jgi:signal transduction histidine kinase